VKNVSKTFSGKTMSLDPIDKQKQEFERTPHSDLNHTDIPIRLPLLRLPDSSKNQRPASTALRAVRLKSSSCWNESSGVSDYSTMIIPVISADPITDAVTSPVQIVSAVAESQITLIRKLVKSSGIYALASIAPPLVTLGLAPFLTRHLSPSDYGAFTLLNNFISLTAGITQLGLGSAFFRAYSYDYSLEKDRRDVLATVTLLLILASSITLIGAALFAPFLTGILLGQPSYKNLIVIAAGIVCAQNLSVPLFSWLRAENRPFFYSLLAISNILVALISSLLLVGLFSLGITGALIAGGSGYVCVAICALLFILQHAGLKIRFDIARNVLAFGVPLVLNVISYWALQVLDRYLLSLFSSLVQTAEYAVAYSLGSALSILVIAPFNLAWPSIQFSIAKRKDAALVFRQTFRLFSMFLLFAAYGLSLAAKSLLDLLFPSAYQSAASIIPIVATSLVFFGVYCVFVSGISIKRMTWVIGIYSTVAAVINLALNLVLIPRYQAMGAAIATLMAYIALAAIAYIVNQRIYPISFEIGKFACALLLGCIFFVGVSSLTQSQPPYIFWSISLASLGLYGGCLFAFAGLPIWMRKFLCQRKEGV
jgi:O-antigen/teichoic acid export membrane protein